MKHIGTSTLETERLILRRFTLDDAKSTFTNWASDDEVTKYLTIPTHRTVDDSIDFIKSRVDKYNDLSFYNWIIELKDTHEIIGNICILEVNEKTNGMEFGWIIGRKYWGKGYAPEACNKIMDVLFNEVGVEYIFATHDVENIKSGKAMLKLGMKLEGILRHNGKNNRGIVDCARYSILKSEKYNN